MALACECVVVLAGDIHFILVLGEVNIMSDQQQAQMNKDFLP